MDTVLDKKKAKRKTLLVLTERKTRFEIISLMKDKTTVSVVKGIDELEKKYDKGFSKIFKTITVDNGIEFADFINMQRSLHNKKERTRIYFCHPYGFYERGSNEYNNRLIKKAFT